MDLRPFPEEAEDLLTKTKAPPRLHAHLALVHDVACQLTAQIHGAWPDLVFDEKAVHVGSAIHDIGNTAHPLELSEPGRLHEDAGRKLLLELGWPEKLGRFSVIHEESKWLLHALEDGVSTGEQQTCNKGTAAVATSE